MIEQLQGLGTTIGGIFIELSKEYPSLLDGILIVFAAIGVLISASAAFDVMKIGRTDQQSGGSRGSTIFWKLIAGASLVDLAFWSKVWTGTLWATENPLGISEYVANGDDNNAQIAMMAALGIIVIAGYVTLGRAYLSMTKLGFVSQEARSDLIGNIISRVIAGSLMIAAIHVAKAIDNSAGFNWIPA